METGLQKFHRGDVVHIAKNLGSWMSHFEADEDVVIIGSYCDQFHHHSIPPVDGRCVEPNGHSYTVLFFNGGEVSWYAEHQLTFLRTGGPCIIHEIQDAYEKVKTVQTDMAWIVANWKGIKDSCPGPTISYLMGRIGITNPWGSQGEGLAYYSNARLTIQLLGAALESGDVAVVEARILEVGTVKGIDVRIGG